MTMWGLIPAAGAGTRIQPLAFSKELLPVGSRLEDGTERPRAVSEHLVERMLLAGADRLCFVIGRDKADILTYYGGQIGGASISYAVQPEPAGLCDALFRARPMIAPEETVLIGLPDTIWFPEDGFARLPDDVLSFLLFPVAEPRYFDAVVTDANDWVTEIQVKQSHPRSSWIWGAVKMPGIVFHELHELWRNPERRDEYLGTLVNAWLARGGRARAVRAGEAYVDVGTLHGYREAVQMLGRQQIPGPAFAAPMRRPPAPATVTVA
jgi:glucose-1-phosphate thymidylyltransferase